MAKLKEAPARELPPGVPEANTGASPPEDLAPPPFGTPKVIDPAGELPRVCDQLDRVPGGSRARRYKCRCGNYDGFRQVRYVLAADAESAKQCHLKSVGLEGYLRAQRAAGVKDAELPAPQVHVTELPD